MKPVQKCDMFKITAVYVSLLTTYV